MRLTEREAAPQGGYKCCIQRQCIKGVLLERPFELIIMIHHKVVLFKLCLIH
jgi:hypothetical protein